MNVESQKYSEGYRIITQFFKCIGLYNDFLEYQRDTSGCYRSFDTKTKDPIKEFGVTSISMYMRSKNKTIYLPESNHTLYYVFIYFVKTFYPSVFDSTNALMLTWQDYYEGYNRVPCIIDRERKTIKLFKSYKEARLRNNMNYW
jgi:hypothetical protein